MSIQKSLSSIFSSSKAVLSHHSMVCDESNAVIKEGSSLFLAENLSILIAKTQLCITKNSLHLEALEDNLSSIQELEEERNNAELLSLNKNLLTFKKKIESTLDSLHYLHNILTVKELSIKLFDRSSPTRLPDGVIEVIEEIHNGNSRVRGGFLGEGCFGIVKKLQIGQIACAEKTIHTKSESGFFDPKKLRHEAALLIGLNHKNIIQIAGASLKPASLIMHLANRTSLYNNLTRPVIYEKGVLLKILSDIADGLTYLHKLDLTHCDLHLGNILLHEEEGNFEALITDFELSALRHCSNATKGNTLIQSPEALSCDTDNALSYRKMIAFKSPPKKERLQTLLFENQITNKTDVWSFGMILFSVLVAGLTPYQLNKIKPQNFLKRSLKFHDVTYLDLAFKKNNGNHHHTKLGLHHQDPLTIELRDSLISKCFNIDPDDRPSMSKVFTLLETLLKVEQLQGSFKKIEISH